MFQPPALTDNYAKLESIIAPHTHARRTSKRDKENPKGTPFDKMRGKFAHYTSSEAALNIIRTKRLWMRSTTCMVDYTEVVRGHKILCDLLAAENGKRREQLKQACDLVYPGVAHNAITRFDQLWDRNYMRLRMYISSVCEHDHPDDLPNGRLSMWRAFGKSPRTALTFSLPWNSDAPNHLGVFFNPVAYFDVPEFAADLDAAIANISRETDFLKQLPAPEFENIILQMFLAYITCTKHEGFKEEREWRAVFVPDIGRPHSLEHEVLAVEGVPQTVFKMPFDAKVLTDAPEVDMSECLEHLIVGPSPFSWVQYEAFQTELNKINCRAEIVSSPLPIRG